MDQQWIENFMTDMQAYAYMWGRQDGDGTWPGCSLSFVTYFRRMREADPTVALHTAYKQWDKAGQPGYEKGGNDGSEAEVSTGTGAAGLDVPHGEQAGDGRSVGASLRAGASEQG